MIHHRGWPPKDNQGSTLHPYHQPESTPLPHVSSKQYPISTSTSSSTSCWCQPCRKNPKSTSNLQNPIGPPPGTTIQEKQDIRSNCNKGIHHIAHQTGLWVIWRTSSSMCQLWKAADHRGWPRCCQRQDAAKSLSRRTNAKNQGWSHPTTLLLQAPPPKLPTPPHRTIHCTRSTLQSVSNGVEKKTNDVYKTILNN